MSISATNVFQNHRAVAFQFTGDGSTTSITVPHGRFGRSGTAQAFVVTGGTKFSTRSGRGGHSFPEDGTAVTATATVSGLNVILTTSPAVSNGVVAFCTVVHDGETD